MSVEVETIADDVFLVKVNAATSTEHRVTLTDAYWEQVWSSGLPKFDEEGMKQFWFR